MKKYNVYTGSHNQKEDVILVEDLKKILNALPMESVIIGKSYKDVIRVADFLKNTALEARMIR